MLYVTDQNFEEEVLNSDIPVVVDFYADWCGPCVMLTPTLEELAKEYEGKLKIVKLDVQQNNQTAVQFKVMGIPALIFFEQGVEKDRLVGLQSKELIKEKLDSLISQNFQA